MKTLLVGLVALVSLSAFSAEGYLPGRVEAKHKGHQIAAKCALRNASSGNCEGYQFYYLPNGSINQAYLIGEGILTLKSIAALKKSGSNYNVLDGRTDEFGAITKNSWEGIETLNEARASESVVADVVYGFLYYAGYAVVTPFAAIGDGIGTALGTPFYLIGKSTRNSKLNKLIQSIETGKIEKINVQRLKSLEHMIWCQTNEDTGARNCYP